MLDLVGIGALNLGYITTARRLRFLEPELVSEFANRFEHGNERPVKEEAINTALSRLGRRVFGRFLGGSAFNVIHTVAAINVGLRLGCVGRRRENR